MKKIVLVCNTSWGMMMFRVGLMKRLVKEGHQVYVLAPKDDHSDNIVKLGCHYIEVIIDNKGSNIFKDLFLLHRLYKQYKKIKPDLIFHYTIKPNIYGTLAAYFTGFKSIAVITGLGYTFINYNSTAKIAKLLYKISLKKSQKVWFINYEDRKKFIKDRLLSRDLMEILPSEGVDMVKYAPREKRVNDNVFRFVLIARLLWDKGVGELIIATEEIKKKYKNVEVQFVGFVDVDNPQAISKKQVDEWMSKGLINYLGSTDDVRNFIGDADCVVLPSYREGISKILLEAASMAKPIIASNVPGCRDIVEQASSGYLCRVKDPKDLELKMQKMLTLSNAELRQMGKRGREHIKREFNEEIVIKKYLKTIKFYTSKDRQKRFTLKKD